ncbi:FP1, partial [Symbiodinium microadriaticum]
EYIDAREDTSLVARYINDCRNPAVYNVSFEKRPGEGRALVVACRPISAGEELFVDYGRWYWAKLRPIRIAVKQAAEILRDAEYEAERQRAVIPAAEGDLVEKLQP